MMWYPKISERSKRTLNTRNEINSDFFGLVFKLYKYFVANKEPIKRAMLTTVRGSNCRYRAEKKDEADKIKILIF